VLIVEFQFGILMLATLVGVLSLRLLGREDVQTTVANILGVVVFCAVGQQLFFIHT